MTCAPKVIFPVPFASNLKSSLLLEDVITLSSIVIASLAIDVVAVIAPVTFVFACNSIVPVPAGSITIFSFDCVPFISASSMVKPSVVNEVAVAPPVIVTTPEESVDVVMFVPPCIYNVPPSALSTHAES